MPGPEPLQLSPHKSNRRGRPRRDAPTDQIRELRVQGLSFRAIARQTGLGYGTVRRAYQAASLVQFSGAD
jgi:DNA invertase Pin-like site-specific DNA recombinase